MSNATKLKKTFAEQIKQARLSLGMTQDQLAERLGMEQADLSDLEQGQRNVQLTTINRLATALGVDPAILLSSDPILR